MQRALCHAAGMDGERTLPEIRTYDAERDFASVARIWREVRWIDSGEDAEKPLTTFLEHGDALLQPGDLAHRFFLGDRRDTLFAHQFDLHLL